MERADEKLPEADLQLNKGRGLRGSSPLFFYKFFIFESRSDKFLLYFKIHRAQVNEQNPATNGLIWKINSQTDW